MGCVTDRHYCKDRIDEHTCSVCAENLCNYYGRKPHEDMSVIEKAYKFLGSKH